MASIESLIERVRIIACGVSSYKHMNELTGTINDVKSIKNILVEDNRIAIYKDSQCVWLEDPDSHSLRTALTYWASKITASNDILIFYFSGHAVPLVDNDIGLCTTDTNFIWCFNEPIITTLVPFSEIVKLIASSKADPIIILDTCYSGEAGEILQTVFSGMRRTLQADTGSSYALMSSCRSQETSIDLGIGSLYSNALLSVSKKGIRNIDLPYLTLTNMYEDIQYYVNQSDYLISPQLFVGATLPAVPWGRNLLYKPRTESFAPYYVKILRSLWNDGNPRVLNTSDFNKLISAGAYGNNTKLSLEPWGLVNIGGESKKQRELTMRGIEFLQGKIKIPKKIVLDPYSNQWAVAPDSAMLSINDFEDYMIASSDQLNLYFENGKN